MRTAIYLIFTCLISTGALLGALNAKNPFPAFIVAFGIWALFLWGWSRRMKRNAERREMERNFQEFMRYQKRRR